MLDAEQLSPERVRPVRRSEYEQLVAAGAFDDERVELLRGWLVEMSPQSSDHAASTTRIATLLIRMLGDDFWVRSQCPLVIGDHSVPEPDVAVVRRMRFDAHPATAVLVVEVAQSSLRNDRGVKASIYAEAHVPEYWIVDLDGRAVEIRTRPEGGAYQAVAHVGEDGVLCPAGLPDVAIPVAEILPPR